MHEIDPYLGIEGHLTPPEPSLALYPTWPHRSRVEFLEWVERSFWKFATTMPYAPHWYTLRKLQPSEVEFESMVVFIRRHGFIQPYPPDARPGTGRLIVYFEIEGNRFWTMGEPLSECTLMNRTPMWSVRQVKPSDEQIRQERLARGERDPNEGPE